MFDVDITGVGTTSVPRGPFAIERTAIKLLGYIPGLQGLAPSRRVMVAMRGGTWTIVGYGASQLFRLASTLVLARMLVPQTFGVVALVSVCLSGLEMLSDLGIATDVVRHTRGDDPRFVNTAFLIQAGRGIVLWAIATALAYPIARFYQQPALLPLLVVGSLSVLLRGLTSGSIWGLTRHVQLGKYNLLTTGSDFFGFLVSLSWAIASPTAWALVIGRVASSLAFVIVSHAIAERRVSLSWDPKAARDIFAFGSGIILGTGTYFLSGEAERLVVGKFITLVELGCFSLALSMSSAMASGLQQIIVQVFFPMMSHSLREDRDAAIGHFKKARYVLCAASACFAVAFIVGSRWIVSLVLGPKYEMAGWMLQLLGVRGALELFILVSASMLFALGYSRYAAIGNTLKLIYLAVGLTIAFGSFGFHEALWVLMVAPLASYISLLFGLRRHCKEVFRTELVGFGAFLISVIVAMLVTRTLW